MGRYWRITVQPDDYDRTQQAYDLARDTRGGSVEIRGLRQDSSAAAAAQSGFPEIANSGRIIEALAQALNVEGVADAIGSDFGNSPLAAKKYLQHPGFVLRYVG